MKKNETSLNLAISISVASFITVFIATVHMKYGISTLPIITGYPEFLRDLIAQVVGASFLMPAILVAITSIFKSKRNSSTRRQIFIGWATFVIILELFTLVMQRPSI